MADSAHHDTELRVGEWLVHPALNTLTRAGDERRVGPKVMAVLGCLIDHRGGVVGKQELIDQVWRGSFTSDEAVAAVIYELRKALDDDARQPRYVETIRGSGYRLIASIERSPTRLDPANVASTATPLQSRPWRILAGLILVILLAATAWALATSRRAAPPTGPLQPTAAVESLAVLPFSTLAGGHLEEERFAGGLTEEVSAALARQRPVELAAALNSSTTDRWALRQRARDFEVDAILEGSVYRSQDRLLVSVQLVELESGIMLWGHSYERQLGDPLLLQLELARDIAEQVGHQLD